MRLVALVTLFCVAAIGLAGPCVASGLSRRLEPRLASALRPGAAPVPVWVEFVDKGEQGISDLERRLGAAAMALTPAARARRIRAGVGPLVDYLDLPVDSRYVDALAARGYRPYAMSRWMNGCAVRVSGAALAALGELDFVQRLSPAEVGVAQRPEPVIGDVFRRERPRGAAAAAGTPSFYGLTYAPLAQLNVPALHDSGYNGVGVTIAMLDAGFNYFDKHEATRNIDVIATRDFVRGIESVQDTVDSPCLLLTPYMQHGTWTLGCLGGNAPGIYVGPAYGASFALARTEDDCTEKPVEMVNWLLAAEWADSLGADIISSSLGYEYFDSAASITPAMLDGHTTIITRAAEIAAAKGILVVNSAGNSGAAGYGSLLAPADANGDSVLSVGAVDSAGMVADFSSRGPTADGRIKPDVMARGIGVVLPWTGGEPDLYLTGLTGTSFACPLTAGLAACVMSARPTWTPRAVIRAIKLTASRASAPDNDYGWGIPDGQAILRWAPDTTGVPAGPPLYLALESRTPVKTGESVRVRFGLPPGVNASTAHLAVYDVAGREVRTLWTGTLAPDYPQWASWDGTDRFGRSSSQGIYFVMLEAAGHRASRRLAVIR